MHTTASDGTSTPEDLVSHAVRAGLTTISVTDHDTMAAVPSAAAAAARNGVAFVSGIEVTSVHHGHDVHMLGYFLDADSPELAALLRRLRSLRLERATEIADRLATAGAPIDVASLVGAHRAAGSATSIARPQIARALIAAGHVATVSEAFDRFLSDGCCAYVPHRGPSPADAIAVIHAAGGIASLAHPGTLKQDDLVPALAASGLAAIEAYHSSHDAAMTAHYLQLARAHDLAVSGGSDFHGDGTRRSECFGVVGLPRDEFERLSARVCAGKSRPSSSGLA